MRQRADGTIAGIELSGDAIRLELGRQLPDGSIEIVHEERDWLRPGQMLQAGAIAAKTVDRMLSTTHRYATLCRRYQAQVRVVATGGIREAGNRDQILRRIEQETGLEPDVISGEEETRLVCLGVLAGRGPRTRSICIDIGEASTEVAAAQGERPTSLWSLPIGTGRLTEMLGAAVVVKPRQLKVMRSLVDRTIADVLPGGLPGFPRVALDSSGIGRELVGFVDGGSTGHATTQQLARAVDQLVRLGPAGRRQRFDPQHADSMVAGAVILEALARRLRLEGISAVEGGLPHGVLVDLVRRGSPADREASLFDAAITLGRHFHFDEAHARQVTRLALALFDQLGPVHKLPREQRVYIEVAALLHEIGNALSDVRHHQHSEYLIRNSDIPGLADRERDLAARIARFHRRSPPERDHPGMDGLSPAEVRTVRRLASLLRAADALDHGNVQAVRRLRVVRRPHEVLILIAGRGGMDLELWDAAHETALFRRVFGTRLVVKVEP